MAQVDLISCIALYEVNFKFHFLVNFANRSNTFTILTMGLYTYLKLLYFQILKRDFFQIRSFNIQGKNHINLIKFAQLCSFSICILLQSIIYSFQACQIIFRFYRMHRNKFWRCILIFTHLCFNEFFNESSTNTFNILLWHQFTNLFSSIHDCF